MSRSVMPVLHFVALTITLGACASTPAVAPAIAGTPIEPAASTVERPYYDPRSGESPRILLAVPEDGVAYYQTRVRAEQLARQGNHAEAEPLLEQLVREYSRDPETWIMLASTKTALEKPLEAIPAWEQVGRLIGWDLQFWAAYYIAENHLAAGNRREALDVLRHQIFERGGFARTNLHQWQSFASLREDPEFLEMIGRPDTTGWSRNEGWTFDLDLLVTELKRVNPDYRYRPLPAEVTRRYEQLKQDIPTLSDEQIYYQVNRMLAPLHQGHVSLFSFPGNRHLPIRFYVFPDGIYIIEAAEEHVQLVGTRVHSIGTLPADEALRRLAEARSADGDMEYLWIASALAQTGYLKGMGAIESVNAVTLDIQRSGESRQTVTIATRAEAPAGRQDRLVAPRGVAPPLFLSRMDQMHWELALPEHDALYVQVNNLIDDSDETLPQFGLRLLSVLEETRPMSLILDLRHNNGGTTQRYAQLLRTVTAFSRTPGNQLYVLIGRRSFSATGNLVTDLERLAAPIFVGEASSECCNLYGDPTSLRLPYSGIQGELTAYKWQLSAPGDRRREMSPDVPVQLTAEAFFAGRDPALEAVFRLIASGATALPRFW